MPDSTVTVRAARSSATTSFISRSERKCVGAVGDAVEAVPRAEHLEVLVLSDELLDLLERRRRRDAVGAVPIVAGPVAQRLVCAASAGKRPIMADTADVLTTVAHCPTNRRRL